MRQEKQICRGVYRIKITCFLFHHTSPVYSKFLAFYNIFHGRSSTTAAFLCPFINKADKAAIIYNEATLCLKGSPAVYGELLNRAILRYGCTITKLLCWLPAPV
jgi:hypothetical protein